MRIFTQIMSSKQPELNPSLCFQLTYSRHLQILRMIKDKNNNISAFLINIFVVVTTSFFFSLSRQMKSAIDLQVKLKFSMEKFSCT